MRARVVVVAPGDARPFDAREWRDALVVVERGEIELEGRSGAVYPFGCGAVLWLDGLPLRALRNRGGEPAELLALSRA